MSFWNNPEYSQLRILLLIAIVAIGGWAVYNFAGNGGNSVQQGSVFQGTKKGDTQNNQKTTVTVTDHQWGVTCDLGGDGYNDWTVIGEQTGNWAEQMAFYINACEDAGGIPTTSTKGGQKKDSVAYLLKTTISLGDSSWSVSCDVDGDGVADTTASGGYVDGWKLVFEYAVNSCEASGGTPTTSGGNGPDKETADPGIN